MIAISIVFVGALISFWAYNFYEEIRKIRVALERTRHDILEVKYIDERGDYGRHQEVIKSLRGIAESVERAPQIARAFRIADKDNQRFARSMEEHGKEQERLFQESVSQDIPPEKAHSPGLTGINYVSIGSRPKGEA